MTSNPLIRPPAQRRSQESLERVLNSGLEVLKEQGIEGFTIHEVSQRAGVSTSSIYARVPSREALIMAIYENATNWPEEVDTINAAGKRDDLGAVDRIELIVAALTSQILSHSDTLRVFMRSAPIYPEIRARAAEQSQELGSAFREAILRRREDIAHPDPELASDMAFRLAYAAIVRRITHGARFESPRSISDSDFIQELGRAVARYLHHF